LILRNEHTLGDIYYLDQKAQVSATFLRNNSLHVFILPSLIAGIFVNTEKSSRKRIQAICYRFYPFLKAEFFLPWDLDEIEGVISAILATLERSKLIEKAGSYYLSCKPETEQFQSLLVLSGACKATIERFYIAAQLVNSQANGYYDQKSLETACVQTAERLSLLHEFHAPDFFDKNLFRIFIASLIREDLFFEDEYGRLEYRESFMKAKKLDKYVLTPSIKRSIRHITQASLAEGSPAEGSPAD
jgi:glycerol-3-phosphate O-acyltransferase